MPRRIYAARQDRTYPEKGGEGAICGSKFTENYKIFVMY